MTEEVYNFRKGVWERPVRLPLGPDPWIMRKVKDVINAFDDGDEYPCVERKWNNFVELGGIEPLREIITMFGDPDKAKPNGVLEHKPS